MKEPALTKNPNTLKKAFVVAIVEKPNYFMIIFKSYCL